MKLDFCEVKSKCVSKIQNGCLRAPICLFTTCTEPSFAPMKTLKLSCDIPLPRIRFMVSMSFNRLLQGKKEEFSYLQENNRLI